MGRKFLKWLMLLTFVGVLVFSTVAPALATGAQNWYLDSTYHPTLPAVGKVMEKGPALYNQQSGTVTIPGNGGTQLWLADEVALCDVTFPNGFWVLHLLTDTYWGGYPSPKCLIAIGEWDVAESNPLLKFKPFIVTEQAKLTWDNGKHIMKIDLQMGAQTVHKNNYLALMVTNIDHSPNGTGISHIVYTNGRSFVESPGSDPGYPTPEIATIVLLGIGLTGLVGYLVIRRKVRTSAKA